MWTGRLDASARPRASHPPEPARHMAKRGPCLPCSLGRLGGELKRGLSQGLWPTSVTGHPASLTPRAPVTSLLESSGPLLRPLQTPGRELGGSLCLSQLWRKVGVVVCTGMMCGSGGVLV